MDKQMTFDYMNILCLSIVVSSVRAAAAAARAIG